MLFSLLENPDLTLRTIAIETIGFIGLTPEGKMALQKHGQAMNTACKVIGQHIGDGSTETRNKSIEAMTNLVNLRVSTTDILKQFQLKRIILLVYH